MAFLGRRGKRSAPRAAPSAGRCGCGRGIPAGRTFCPSCTREGSKGGAVATTYPCPVHPGRTVRNGVCPHPDH